MLVLIHLALTFGMLSLLAVGGGTAVLHEMQEVLQQTYKITADTFVHVYSVGQLAPGPNMTMVLIFGFQIAGAFGAAIVGLSFFLPSSFLCFWIGRIWNRIGDTPWRRSVQSALEPISIGIDVLGGLCRGQGGTGWACDHRVGSHFVGDYPLYPGEPGVCDSGLGWRRGGD
ncbi:MAG: chromate transporter [Burkholderiaceae bacterium]|nr:chromate transporter [Burkholderiaceae bacterium]